MTSFHTRKVFPLRLPQNFHGQLPQKRSLVHNNKMKIKQRFLNGNPELGQQLSPSKKVTTWQKKRSDSDVIRQRRQMVIHPAYSFPDLRKISEENPDWLKTTFDYFRKNSIQPLKRETRAQWESYDVFGRARGITYADNTLTQNRFSSQFEVTGKIGEGNKYRQSVYKDVTPKVGSVETRDLSIRKPQMKVGKADFIDTYSPF